MQVLMLYLNILLLLANITHSFRYVVKIYEKYHKRYIICVLIDKIIAKYMIMVAICVVIIEIAYCCDIFKLIFHPTNR